MCGCRKNPGPFDLNQATAPFGFASARAYVIIALNLYRMEDLP